MNDLLKRAKARITNPGTPSVPEDTELIRDLAFALRAEQETWTDEHGVTWGRPTAWAFAQLCSASLEHRARAERAEAELRLNGANIYSPSEEQVGKLLAQQLSNARAECERLRGLLRELRDMAWRARDYETCRRIDGEGRIHLPSGRVLE
jgi:hypothetical protein